MLLGIVGVDLRWCYLPKMKMATQHSLLQLLYLFYYTDIVLQRILQFAQGKAEK